MLIHLPFLHLFISSRYIFTEEEIEYIDKLEEEWKQQKILSIHELLIIFPEAKQIIIRTSKQKIKQLKEQLKNIRQVQWALVDNRTKDPVNKELFQLWIDDEEQQRKDIFKQIKRIIFTIQRIKNPEVIPTGKITEADIAHAKEVPLENFLQINQAGFAHCPFHQDKTPSLKIYKKQNRWFCFSCNSGCDIIDLIMRQDNCDFLTAVKKLINKK